MAIGCGGASNAHGQEIDTVKDWVTTHLVIGQLEGLCLWLDRHGRPHPSATKELFVGDIVECHLYPVLCHTRLTLKPETTEMYTS